MIKVPANLKKKAQIQDEELFTVKAGPDSPLGGLDSQESSIGLTADKIKSKKDEIESLE